jgi:hypothetical protein
MDNQDQTVAQEAQAPAADQPQLGIADLQNLRILVDTAVRRGAFSAAESSAVGATFDRLNAFLNAVAPAQAPADQAPADQAPTA